MKMYAACLASYNNGTLHGEWFDLEDFDDKDELLAAIGAQVLLTSPTPGAEEWAAHDWDGEGLSQFGEYPDLDAVLEHVRLMAEHGDAWVAYVETVGSHWATEEDFHEAYRGEFDSPEDWARDFLESTGGLESIPESLRGYFDFEAYARDAACGDMTFTHYAGTVYAFSNN